MSISKFATADDFQRWEDHAKTLDCYTLKYIMKDCKECRDNFDHFDSIRAGYYSDQMSTYGAELHRRNKELPAGFRHRV